MATATLNPSFLSAYFSVPESTIDSIIESPTTELVKSFLESITIKAQDHDRLKSERLRLDVELENAVRGGESRARALKTNSDNALAEVSKLRTKLNEEENARTSLEQELQNLRSSSTNTSVETQGLQALVQKLESSNRDTLALLDSKSTSHDKLAEDLAAQHQKLQILRRDISTLQERNQTAENAVSSAKFREQGLHQEVELLKRNNEWFESELKTKSAEYSKYRKEKSARIAELQRLYDESTSNNESLQRTESSLRKRLEELGQQADTSFAKVQQAQEDAARAEESFRAELDNARRLAELHSQSAETARRRVEELENALEEIRESASEEISNVQAELETERQSREAAERKIEELELRLERMETSRPPPGTPGGINHTSIERTGGTGSSVPDTPSGARSRGGLSFTQLYSECNDAKAELETERRRNQRLESTIDEMVRSLETKEPELQELQVEHTRLEAEAAELSSLLELSSEERDAAKKEARKANGQIHGLVTETGLLRQQLRDLNAQIKMLLVEIQILNEGEELSASERLHLEQVARGETNLQSVDGMSDTGTFITQRLVTFKNIFELQETNEKLLRLTRQLGEQMEGEEARAKEDQQAQERAELETLRETVIRYKDELKSITTQSNSFVRERDMFRRMLSHRGQLPPESEFASTFGQSINSVAPETPKTGATQSSVIQSPNSREIADYNKLLKDMQSHFDSYRQEAAVDLGTLKNQLDQLAKDKSELQGAMARGSSQLTLAHERFDMLQANYNLLKIEREELQKRSQTLSENAAKQDLRTQQVAEELIDAKAIADSSRNEISNLKAEKELWKRIEQRLTEDNQSLVEERSRLNKALTDTQNLYNERNLSDSETRRKLESQVESLEGDLRIIKRKLEEETDETKRINSRREYEQDQSRTRIDDLMKSLSNIKEELAATKTARDQLHSRLEEMKIELRSAEERTQALQIRPSQQSNSQVSVNDASGEGENENREQSLALELADLRRNFELTKAELENARDQVEQYKAISQSSEEELQSLNEAHDLFRQEMDKSLEQRDTKIRELQQRLEDISSEMSVTDAQLSELRASAEESIARLDQQKTSFEMKLAQMSDERDRYMETAKFHQEDLKAQAEIAQQAQKSYDYELVKHAEATQTLTKVRDDYNQLRSEVASLKADAEAARMSLSQSEESWNATREQYEREMVELRSRRDDINDQNKLLHQQLETVSAQIASLQQNRQPADEESGTQAPGERGLRNLQEVIKYLRREKEIVDVQYELSIQESKRNKQQLDYTKSQLDEIRLKLDQERHHRTESEQSSISHAKLMDTINELNVFRESSVTLRNEARQAQGQLAEKSKEAENLLALVQPLEAKVRELENERESAQGEMKLLQEDRDRWQQRTKSVLQKYDRIDPADLEALKEQITTLQRERDDSVAEQKTLQERIDAIPSEIQKAQEELRKAHVEGREKMIDQFKQRSRDLSSKINESRQENTKLTEKIAALEKETEDLRSQLEAAKAAHDNSVASVAALSETHQETQTRIPSGEEDGQISEAANSTNQELKQRLSEAEERLKSEITASSQLRSEFEVAQNQANDLQSQLDKANSMLQDLRVQHNGNPSLEASTALATLREKSAAAEEAIEDSRSSDLAVASTENSASSEVEKQIELIRAELETNHKERLQELEAQYQTRAANMKNQLSTKLHQGKTAIREEMGKEKEEALQNLQRAHDEIVAGLNAAHQKEISELKDAGEKIQGQVLNSDKAGMQEIPRPATENSVNASSTIKVKAESSPLDYEWSEAQIKELIDKNPIVKGVLSRNITARVKRETDALTSKLNDEHDKDVAAKLDESRQKAEKTREQAVIMEGKRWNVKISMAESKTRTALAKIEIFEKAATETPQRPVAEVWAIAKSAKPPPPPQPQSQGSPGAAGRQTPAPSQIQTSQAQPVSTKSTGSPIQPNGNLKALGGTPVVGQSTQSKDSAALPAGTQKPQQNGVATSKLTQSQQSVGTGPAVLRGLMVPGSGIPRRTASQTSVRGSQSGQADTTVNQSAQSAQAQQPNQAQPSNQRGGSGIPARGSTQTRVQRGGGGGGRVSMNPGAQQFVPGNNKRTREDSSDGGGTGKRPRGGGGGAGAGAGASAAS